MKPSPILAANEIKKRLGSTDIIRGVSINIKQGEILAITGPSGSGKSTLLYCLSGILLVDSGSVTYDGTRLKDLANSKLTKLRRTDFGFIFQSGELVPELSVRDNIALPLLVQGIGKRKAYKQVDSWINRVGLDHVTSSLPYAISGGEVQRTAIARAMIINPKIIFADEPTGSLDSKNTKKIMELFVSLAKEHNSTIVIVTHSDNIASYANRKLVLKDGLINSTVA